MCHEYENDTILIDLPECGGTSMTVNGLEFSVFSRGKEAGIITFLRCIKGDSIREVYNSLDAIQHEISSEPITVSTKDGYAHISVPGVGECSACVEQLVTAIKKHIIKYKMYYAAPINYQSFFYKEFDEMVAEFEKYRNKAEELKEMINKM